MLVLLAVFQMVAPSVAAIADAWRLDQREAYAHIESESNASCVVVHAHDCVLCAVATSPTGTAPHAVVPAPTCTVSQPSHIAASRPFQWALARAASPRAPPVIES